MKVLACTALRGLALLCLASFAFGFGARAETSPAASAPAPTHRALRDNVEPQPPTPTEPLVFSGYPNVPPFKVAPQKDKLALYPCSQCHKAMTPNPKPRKLVSAPHNASLVHGAGRLWCLSCHSLDNRDMLQTLRGDKVDFDDAYLVCGQCHFNRQKDWYFGGHGKRVADWRGPRTLYNCTHCHDPHSPAIAPRAPAKPPPVRAGLKPMDNPHAAEPVSAYTTKGTAPTGAQP